MTLAFCVVRPAEAFCKMRRQRMMAQAHVKMHVICLKDDVNDRDCCTKEQPSFTYTKSSRTLVWHNCLLPNRWWNPLLPNLVISIGKPKSFSSSIKHIVFLQKQKQMIPDQCAVMMSSPKFKGLSASRLFQKRLIFCDTN